MPVLVDLLHERRQLVRLVQILEPQLINGHVKTFGNLCHVRLGDEHGLRASKSPEGRVRVCVSLADESFDMCVFE